MIFVIGRTLTILSWDNPVTAFFRKSKKLRHSLGRPSRSDFVQSGFSGQSGNIENSYTAEIQCGENLNTIFGYNPRSDQVDIKAVEGKDGDVLVRVKILDEELQKELEEMGPNDQSWLDTDDGKIEEFYFGYAPTTGSYAHICYGNTKSIVKERIGW